VIEMRGYGVVGIVAELKWRGDSALKCGRWWWNCVLKVFFVCRKMVTV
jgi:hypothetical protein